MTTVTITSSRSWVCPAGVTAVDIVVAGGGGGGGSGAGGSNTGGGGGGAATVVTVAKVGVTPSTSYSISVGSAGAGRAPSAPEARAGYAGSESSAFGYTAAGGAAGSASSGSANGSSGGSSSGGTGGSGGAYGPPDGTATAGGNASGYGSGGGGGGGIVTGSGTGGVGGNGSGGAVIITYTLPTVAFNGVGTGSSDPPTGPKPMTVDWTNDSTNGTTYQWTFTGANSTSSTDEEPADSTYAVAGNFNVTLRVDNAYGWSSLTKAGYVTVYGTPFNRACFIMADHHRGR